MAHGLDLCRSCENNIPRDDATDTVEDHRPHGMWMSQQLLDIQDNVSKGPNQNTHASKLRAHKPIQVLCIQPRSLCSSSKDGS